MAASTITVVKRDHDGNRQLSYQGEVNGRGDNWIQIEATFTFEDKDAGYVTFRKGDVFTEYFYTDRWYNIFRLQDVETGNLKGWYCNITRPAEITQTSVMADDLALDVFISPRGESLLLDENEFDQLALSVAEKAHALMAVDQILELVQKRLPPFDEIKKG